MFIPFGYLSKRSLLRLRNLCMISLPDLFYRQTFFCISSRTRNCIGIYIYPGFLTPFLRTLAHFEISGKFVATSSQRYKKNCCILVPSCILAKTRICTESSHRECRQRRQSSTIYPPIIDQGMINGKSSKKL